MSSREEEIISVFEYYHAITGLAYATIGTRANNDSRLYARLKTGESSCGNKVYRKVMDWFALNTPVNTDNKISKTINQKTRGK